MKRSIILPAFILSYVLFLTINFQLNGEVLAPPPVSTFPEVPGTGFFPSVAAWTYVNHYFPEYSDPYHNWKYEIGSFFTFYSMDFGKSPPSPADGKNTPMTLGIGGTGRAIIRTRLAEDKGQWFFWPYIIVNDLKLVSFLKADFATFSLYFRHDCKHDLDTSRVRLIIHDIFGAEIRTSTARLFWGNSPGRIRAKPIQDKRLSSGISGNLMAEYTVRPVFQEYPREIDDFTLAGSMELELLRIPDTVTIFAEGRIAGILRERSVSTGERGWDTDWLLRLGVRLPTAIKGFTIYLEREHLTDDWVSQRRQPVDLFSFGLAAKIEAFSKKTGQ